MSKGSDPPPAPDYAAAATAQGAANIEAAKQSGYMNNPNVNNPYGSQAVTFDPTTGQPTVTQTLNPQSQSIFDSQQATRLGLANLGNSAIGTVQGVMGSPFQYNGPGVQTSVGSGGNIANSFASGGNIQAAPGGPPSTGTLSERPYSESSSTQPTQASNGLFDFGMAQANVQGGQGIVNGVQSGGQINSGPSMGQYGYAKGLAGNAYGSAAGIGGGDFGNAGSVNAGDYGKATGGPAADAYGLAGAKVDRGAINQGPRNEQYGLAQQNVAGPTLQAQVNTQGIANMPVNAGMTGQQAIMSRLQPQIQQQDQAYAAQLANQGILQGSEAYDNAMRVHNQANNDLLSQAALQGINLDLTANNQGYNQALSSGQFANQSALAGFDARMQNANLNNSGMQQNYNNAIAVQQANNAAQNLGYTQSVGEQQLKNQAIAQNFGQGQAATQLANAAIGQNFGQALQAQQQANQAVGQNFGQGLQGQQLTNASIGQNFGQGLQGQQLGNQAIAQNYTTGLGVQGAQNAAQAQQFGQNLSQGNFTNTAQNQAYTQNMGAQAARNAAIGQNQSTSLAQQAAVNAAQQQAYNQNLGLAQFGNQAQNQQYNQGLASGQFANTAQQQALQQQIGMRELPLNEISALMSGSQIQSPQFQGYTGSQVAPPPIAQAAQNQYNAQLQAYGQQNASSNAFNSGLFGLGASALMSPVGTFAKLF